jgi:hypothetical protein
MLLKRARLIPAGFIEPFLPATVPKPPAVKREHEEEWGKRR